MKIIPLPYPLGYPRRSSYSEITLTVWFCLKHRKSMSTLLKLGLTLARKIQNDPKIIEHLVQHDGELVTSLTPPDPSPQPSSTTTESAAIVSKPKTGDNIFTLKGSLPYS